MAIIFHNILNKESITLITKNYFIRMFQAMKTFNHANFDFTYLYKKISETPKNLTHSRSRENFHVECYVQLQLNFCFKINVPLHKAPMGIPQDAPYNCKFQELNTLSMQKGRFLSLYI